MKFLVAVLLTALLSFASSLFFQWWIISVAAFIVSVCIPQTPVKAFLSAFLALFILWGVHSAYIDQQNEHILSAKIASVLPLGGSSIAIIFVSALVGGLVAGFAALTGSLVRLSNHQTDKY